MTQNVQNVTKWYKMSRNTLPPLSFLALTRDPMSDLPTNKVFLPGKLLHTNVTVSSVSDLLQCARATPEDGLIKEGYGCAKR